MEGQSEAAALTSALGTLIGYIGSEAAIEASFERLLWPQRFFNAVSWRELVSLGLLAPMGGPVHKAALTTLDKFHRNGIFRKRDQGNMLGTAFFHDTHLKYHERDAVSGDKSGKEYVRNGLWVQAIGQTAVPSGTDKAEKEKHVEEAGDDKKPLLVRAKSCVNFLTLSYVPTKGKIKSSEIVKNDTGPVRLHTFFILVWTEITSIVTGAMVFAYWRSALSLVWIEVNTQGHGFLVIQGEEPALLQFFRHYGHPKRDRFREVVQIAIVVALGLTFPTSLVLSITLMPVGMQYFWLSYQLYATVALYISRYTRVVQRSQTDAQLAQKLTKGSKGNEDGTVYLQDDKGVTIKAELNRILIPSYSEGQKAVERFFARKLPEWSEEDKTLAGDSAKPIESSGTDLSVAKGVWI